MRFAQRSMLRIAEYALRSEMRFAQRIIQITTMKRLNLLLISLLIGVTLPSVCFAQADEYELTSSNKGTFLSCYTKVLYHCGTDLYIMYGINNAYKVKFGNFLSIALVSKDKQAFDGMKNLTSCNMSFALSNGEIFSAEMNSQRDSFGYIEKSNCLHFKVLLGVCKSDSRTFEKSKEGMYQQAAYINTQLAQYDITSIKINHSQFSIDHPTAATISAMLRTLSSKTGLTFTDPTPDKSTSEQAPSSKSKPSKKSSSKKSSPGDWLFKRIHK